MKYVVDASIAIGWFIKQNGAAGHMRLLDSDNVLVAPDLMFPEVVNGVWRLISAGHLLPKQGYLISTEITECFDQIFPCAPLVQAAMDISLTLDHPAYDCFYLALARREEVQMITADRRLLNKIKGTSYSKLAIGSDTAFS